MSKKQLSMNFVGSSLLCLSRPQGMTLDRAIVRLTRAASSPGVAFVALSRVRHPDHLMLEDTFPDMSTIMKQTEKESFQTRQRWERKMRVLFSQTVRAHMGNSNLYTADKTWTPEDNEIAEACLAALRTNPYASDEEVLNSVWGRRRDVAAVWQKLQTFPHMFEVYAARGEDLMRYDLKRRASQQRRSKNEAFAVVLPPLERWPD